MTTSGAEPKLTIFSIPKHFKGPFDLIQRNAVRSWTLLKPTPDIILFGRDEGTAETAREFNLRHVPDVACNDYGTPLVSDMFRKAEELAGGSTLCYINADIILLSDFLPSLARVRRRHRRFLMVGRRWDLDVKEEMDFAPGWEGRIGDRLETEGTLHSLTGIDYFAFSKGLWGDIPPFAIGRTVWDNWLVYRARSCRAAVVDATAAVTAVHQNHGYSHVKNGKDGAWKGPEALKNMDLAGGKTHIFTIEDARFVYSGSDFVRADSPEHRRRARKVWPALHPRLAVFYPVFSALAERTEKYGKKPHTLPGALVRKLRSMVGKM